MAGPFGVAAIGKAVVGVLSDAMKPAFPAATFELAQSKNLQQPVSEGVSFYLHRITSAVSVRNLRPRVLPDGRRFRPSLPIDLHYLLIAWAADAVTQQILLATAMRVIEDIPLLPASLLNHHAVQADTFGENESIDILLETVSIQDLGAIWDTAKPQMQPCATYVVRMVSIDSRVEMPEFGPVQTRVFGMGKVGP